MSYSDWLAIKECDDERVKCLYKKITEALDANGYRNECGNMLEYRISRYGLYKTIVVVSPIGNTLVDVRYYITTKWGDEVSEEENTIRINASECHVADEHGFLLDSDSQLVYAVLKVVNRLIRNE